MDNSASNNSGCCSLSIENNKKSVNDYIDQNTCENTKSTEKEHNAQKEALVFERFS